MVVGFLVVVVVGFLVVVVVEGFLVVVVVPLPEVVVVGLDVPVVEDSGWLDSLESGSELSGLDSVALESGVDGVLEVSPSSPQATRETSISAAKIRAKSLRMGYTVLS